MNATATRQLAPAPLAPRRARALRISQIVLITAAAFLVVMLANAGSAQAAPNVQFGMEQNGGMDGAEQRTDLLNRQKDLGSTVIRLVMRWDRIATCNPGATGAVHTNACYNWATPDAVAAGAAARGMQVIFSIYGVPSWRNGGKGETYTGGTDAEFNAFAASYADFAQAAITRFNGANGQARVQQWTIWNEPNGQFWTPLKDAAGSPIGAHRYARLFDVASRRIKSVDASMQVAVGPTAPMASKNMPPITWATIVAADLDALGSPIDAWAHNGYMGMQSPFRHTVKSPYVGLGNVSDLTTLLDSHNVTRNLPIWITEFGYQTKPSFQPGVTPAEQAALLTDAMRFAYAHPRITTFIWYSVLDDNTDTGFKSGLYFADGTCGTHVCPKPSAAMFRHPLWISDQANGLVTLWGRGGRAAAQTRIFVRPVGGTWHAYKNADTATTGAVTLTLKLTTNVEAMTCDTVCGPMRIVVMGAPSANNVATTKVITKKLAPVKLRKRAALVKGIAFKLPCAGCKVTSQIIAVKGASSGLAAAKKRQLVVARGASKKVAGGHVITLRFTVGARTQLLKRRGASKLVIRATVTSKSGQVTIYDRSLTLF